MLHPRWQDAVVWNAMYVVRGRQAIFGAVNLWCSMNKIEVKINRMGEGIKVLGFGVLVVLHEKIEVKINHMGEGVKGLGFRGLVGAP